VTSWCGAVLFPYAYSITHSQFAMPICHLTICTPWETRTLKNLSLNQARLPISPRGQISRGGEIRTHGTVSRPVLFKSTALNHYATPLYSPPWDYGWVVISVFFLSINLLGIPVKKSHTTKEESCLSPLSPRDRRFIEPHPVSTQWDSLLCRY
jgi:hypothetical protein